ncbi:unnamed protein product, partial [Allacma fusca]
KDIVQACQRTRIVYFSEINYGGTGYRNSPGEFCYDFGSAYKSARFYGHQNTEEDGVSLFTSINLRGEEIYVAWSPVSGITKRILSLGYSGKSSWTVFEGTNFDGKSACLPPPARINDTSYYNEISKDLNLSRIGSLYRVSRKTEATSTGSSQNPTVGAPALCLIPANLIYIFQTFTLSSLLRFTFKAQVLKAEDPSHLYRRLSSKHFAKFNN